jgi:hypothetical protein
MDTSKLFQNGKVTDSISSNASTVINNALSQYDNEVTETASGQAGFVESLKGSLDSLKSLKDKGMSMVDNLQSNISAIGDSAVTKLNKLAENVKSKLNVDGLLDKFTDTFGDVAGNFLKNSVGMLEDLASDALNQLKNAAVTYVSNIAEDFVNQIKSAIYIPDEVFSLSIEALYYDGADLAYNNHYLRNSCLYNDWYMTLRFVDSKYGIEYDARYSDLENDLSICARNCCHKNLYYMFTKMYTQIKNMKNIISRYESDKEYIVKKNPNEYDTDEKYERASENIDIYNEKIQYLTRLMKYKFKELILFSFSYLTANNVRKFLENFPDILKPSMFSTGGECAFTYNDCAFMMPYFDGNNDISDSDIDYLTNTNNNEAELIKKSNELTENADKTGDIIAKFRATTMENQAKNYKTLNNTAIKKGSTGVYDESFARYSVKGQNSPKNTVKYRTTNIGTVLEDSLVDENEYIILKNENIKQIYILLSNSVIYKDVMVNRFFYNRCKLPTMSVMKQSLSKMKGILGTSYLAQSAFELSDAIDSSAYKYLKQVENYLFNPRENTNFVENFGKTGVFYYDPKIGKMVSSKDVDTDIYGTEYIPSTGTDEYSDGPITSDTNNSSNPYSVKEIDSELTGNVEANIKTITTLRYISNIPMVAKRDAIIKWLSKFYQYMEEKNILEKDTIFSSLNEYVFGKVNITNPDLLEPIFNNSTDISLNTNCKVLISIYNLGKTKHVLNILSNEKRDDIEKLFNTCIEFFSREIQSVGFAKSLMLYDKEYLSSYFKTLFFNEIAYLKSINNKDNNLYQTFYNYKDYITSIITGYDRRGIFGYNDNKDRIQYTNQITGDWLSGAVTSNGTFFGGSDNTTNNGIKYIKNDEIVQTNITSGNWTDIFEYCNTVFFIKDNKYVYYWNGESVVYTDFEQYDKYEFLSIPALNAIFLCSKNENNGFYYWNNGKFEQKSAEGSGWKINKIIDGYAIYPTKSAGYLYFINSKSNLYNTNLKQLFTDIAYTTTKTINIINIPNPSDPNSTISNTTIKYNLFIFAGTSSDGCYQFAETSDIENVYTLTNLISEQSSLINYGNLIIPQRINDKTIRFISDTNIYDVQFVKETTSLSNIFTSDITIQNVSTLETTNYDPIDRFYRYENNLFFITKNETSDEERLYFYNFNTKELEKTDLPSISTIDNKIFFIYNSELYSRNSDSTGLFKYINGKEYDLLRREDSNMNGWTIQNISNKYFLLNENNSVGIRVFDESSNKFITTNITSGYWNLAYSDDYIYALSIKNTNRGIKKSSKNIISFVDFRDNPILDGDIKFGIYDSSLNKIYFGSYRGDLLTNLDNIVFDIDEFIFNLSYAHLEKYIELLERRKLQCMAEALDNIISSESMVDYVNVSEDELNNGPLPNKTYYIKNRYRPITDAERSNGPDSNIIYYVYEDNQYVAIDTITTFDENTVYHILIDNNGDGGYWDLYTGKTLDRFYDHITYYERKVINNPDLSSLLENIQSEISKMETFAMNTEKKSNIYNELALYAESKKEFDVDDDDTLDSLLLDFIYNYDYESDGKTYNDAIKDMVTLYNGRFTKYKIPGVGVDDKYVVTTDPISGKTQVDTSKFDEKYEYTSDEFMNSDPNEGYIIDPNVTRGNNSEDDDK